MTIDLVMINLKLSSTKLVVASDTLVIEDGDGQRFVLSVFVSISKMQESTVLL